MEFTSFNQFKRFYFPKEYLKELNDKLSPEERGRRMAIKSLRRIKNNLKK